jgi:hypothetical protein
MAAGLADHENIVQLNRADNIMTYVRRRVRQRQKWITLSEAVDHVVKVERCNGDDAWWQLRDAVEDGAVTCTEPLTENELDADEPAIKRIFPRIEQRIRRRSPAYWIVRYNGATRPIDRVWLLKESVFELWKDKVLAVKNSKEPASDDEICIALRNIFKDVESGKTRHWDLNSLHGWVEGAVSPKRVKKKEVLKIFRERSEFAQYQREKGRPKSAVAHLKDS